MVVLFYFKNKRLFRNESLDVCTQILNWKNIFTHRPKASAFGLTSTMLGSNGTKATELGFSPLCLCGSSCVF